MKQITSDSQNGYCYHVYVIEYALYAERGKTEMKRTNEVSKLVGVSRRTLQYYDDEEVVVAERSKNNYRLYDQKALEKIWQIMLYKEMGFELKEIKQILSASDNKQKEYLRVRMETVRSEINKLNEQINFISFVLTNGIPQVPEEHDGMTYMKSIEEYKKNDFKNT